MVLLIDIRMIVEYQINEADVFLYSRAFEIPVLSLYEIASMKSIHFCAGIL